MNISHSAYDINHIDHSLLYDSSSRATSAYFGSCPGALAHFWFGPSAENSWSRRFGATGKAWWLSVVRLNRRFCRALRPFSRISRAVRRPPTCSPSSRSSIGEESLPVFQAARTIGRRAYLGRIQPAGLGSFTQASTIIRGGSPRASLSR